jgi:DNA-binding CsgD family transcriptional regulator
MAHLYRLGQPDTKRIARLRAFGMSQRQIANNLGLKPELVNKSVGRYYS